MKKFRLIQGSIVVVALLVRFSIFAGTTHPPAVFATDAGAGANADPTITNAAAIVDGHIISREEVTLKCLREYRSAILQRMIPNYVLDRECQRRGITVDEAEIDRRIAIMRTNCAPKKLEDQLSENHMTMAGARDDIRREIERPLLVADQVKPLPMVHCRELVVDFGSPRNETNALALATDLRRQILAGADFADMAARYPSHGVLKETNGDMGVLYERIRRPVEAPVMDAALAMKLGEVSQPIKASDGYHLVKAESTADHHAPSENAHYTDAADGARRVQVNLLVPQTISALLKQSQMTFADDGDLVPGKPLPETAAVIDGHPILMKDVLDKCLAEAGPKATDNLVQNFLVDRECERRGITVKESEIDERVKALRRQCAPMTLEQGMKMHHTTMAELRHDFRQDIERIQLAISQVQSIRMVHARIILVKASPASELDVERADQVARTQIIAILDQLKAGKRFEDLAAQYCVPDDPGKSGDMGIIYPYMPGIDTDLAKTAGAMKNGEISSQPIKIYGGYALLQILSDSDNHESGEDAAYARTQDHYRSMEAQQVIQQIIVSLIKKSNVIYYVHS